MWPADQHARRSLFEHQRDSPSSPQDPFHSSRGLQRPDSRSPSPKPTSSWREIHKGKKFGKKSPLRQSQASISRAVLQAANDLVSQQRQGQAESFDLDFEIARMNEAPLLIEPQRRERAPNQSAPLTEQQKLERIPKLMIVKTKKKCPVCLEQFKKGRRCSPGDVCRRLPCEHFFHNDCIKKWLLVKMACPNCRHSFDPSSQSSLL